MDIDSLRSIITVMAFVTFLAIVAWAWSGRARRAFEQAERLPFEEEAPEAPGDGGAIR